MSYNTRLNVLIIMTSLAYSLLFAIVIFGHFFPGNPSRGGAPWYVWAAIGEVMAISIAAVTTHAIAEKKQSKARKDNEKSKAGLYALPCVLSNLKIQVAELKDYGR